MFQARRAILSLLLLAALLTNPLEGRDKWITVSSRHFWGLSNAGDGKSKRLLRNLEEFRWVFNRLFGLKDLESVPIRVYIFKSGSSFQPFQPLYEGKPVNLAGFFHQGEDYHVIALDAGSSTDPLKTVFHEYVHFLTSRTDHPLPVWLNEGLAEFYSTFDVRGNEVVLGAPIGYHAELLKTKTMLPLEEFFQVSHSSPEYNEKSKQGVFYAQSWALVHYLMMDEQAAHRPQLIRLINLITEGVDFQTAFQQTFDETTEELLRSLDRYINLKAVYTTVVKLEEIEATKEIETARLEEADAQALLGDLLLHSNRLDEARAYYEEARKLNPSSPRVLEGLGLLQLRLDNYPEAVEYLKGAAEADSDNFLVHFRYAEGLMTESGLLEGKDEVSEEEFDLIRRHLEKVNELRPSYAHAHYLLALLHQRTGRDREAGLEAIQKAISLKPQDPYYRITLSEIQIALERREAARQTLQRLAREDDFTVQRLVHNQLEYLNYLDQRDAMPAELAGIDENDAEPKLAAEAEPEIDLSARPEVPWVESPEPRPAPPPEPDSEAPRSECRPSFANVRNAPRIAARMLRVECSEGLIYTARINGELTRLIGPPDQVILFSCSVPLTEFECGAFEYDATVFFAPGWAKDPETGAFKVLAIEFH